MVNKRKSSKVIWRNKREMIGYHIINSLLAGALVFLGAFTDGTITRQELIISMGVSLMVALTKFKEFWKTQKGVYRPTLFHFIH